MSWRAQLRSWWGGDPGPPALPLVGKLVLSPGLALRHGMLIVTAAALRLDVVHDTGRGHEPVASIPGCSPGPRRAVLTAVPYLAGVMTGVVALLVTFAPSRLLGFSPVGPTATLLQEAVGEDDQARLLIAVMDLVEQGGPVVGLLLWVGVAALATSAPRWQELASFREDLAVLLPGAVFSVVDPPLRWSQVAVRAATMLRVDRLVGGVLLVSLALTGVVRALGWARPFG